MTAPKNSREVRRRLENNLVVMRVNEPLTEQWNRAEHRYLGLLLTTALLSPKEISYYDCMYQRLER